jgi:hypothetical protein
MNQPRDDNAEQGAALRSSKSVKMRATLMAVKMRSFQAMAVTPNLYTITKYITPQSSSTIQ